MDSPESPGSMQDEEEKASPKLNPLQQMIQMKEQLERQWRQKNN